MSPHFWKRNSILLELTLVVAFFFSQSSNWFVSSLTCNSLIYCKGPLLETIQNAQLFPDSKTFVDMPLKYKPEIVLKAFSSLPPNSTKEQLSAFVATYFYPAGSEVAPVVPPDWVPSPSFLKNIRDPLLYTWGKAVHAKWRDLVRQFNHNESCLSCYSSIYVPYPFVVAGGRFREYYYWDSYFIIEGLLVSEMYNTTKNMLMNFLTVVDHIGFFPNGGRIYYLNRSQPPLLTLMVLRYYETTNDLDFLRRALPTLDREYEFWMRERSVRLNFNGTTYTLNIYNVTNDLPRPEAYISDIKLAASLPQSQRTAFFANIASGCETGWDFSSRWFHNLQNQTTIITRNIIPVDLNAILYLNEKTLQHFHTRLGNAKMAFHYNQIATKRLEAMRLFLWSANDSQWYDYNFVDRKVNRNFYVSNFVPLWAQSYDNSFTPEVLEKIVKRLSVLFVWPGGIPTSLRYTGQQWDFPNAWAPLQYFLLEALDRLNVTNSSQLALQLAQKWVTTNFCAWNETLARYGGLMFEKYDATRVGIPGHGGEYQVQEGFGWTNGVALYLLKKYGQQLNIKSC
jgi:alpha,alpha-trehalase